MKLLSSYYPWKAPFRMRALNWIEALRKRKAQQQMGVPLKASRVICSECGIYTEELAEDNTNPFSKGHTSVSNNIAVVVS